VRSYCQIWSGFLVLKRGVTLPGTRLSRKQPLMRCAPSCGATCGEVEEGLIKCNQRLQDSWLKGVELAFRWRLRRAIYLNSRRKSFLILQIVCFFFFFSPLLLGDWPCFVFFIAWFQRLLAGRGGAEERGVSRPGDGVRPGRPREQLRGSGGLSRRAGGTGCKHLDSSVGKPED